MKKPCMTCRWWKVTRCGNLYCLIKDRIVEPKETCVCWSDEKEMFKDDKDGDEE